MLKMNLVKLLRLRVLEYYMPILLPIMLQFMAEIETGLYPAVDSKIPLTIKKI